MAVCLNNSIMLVQEDWEAAMLSTCEEEAWLRLRSGMDIRLIGCEEERRAVVERILDACSNDKLKLEFVTDADLPPGLQPSVRAAIVQSLASPFATFVPVMKRMRWDEGVLARARRKELEPVDVRIDATRSLRGLLVSEHLYDIVDERNIRTIEALEERRHENQELRWRDAEMRRQLTELQQVIQRLDRRGPVASAVNQFRRLFAAKRPHPPHLHTQPAPDDPQPTSEAQNAAHPQTVRKRAAATTTTTCGFTRGWWRRSNSVAEV